MIHNSSASTEPRDELRAVLETIDEVIIGKSRETRLAIACLLARGHLLIEDLPGVGKTTMARALASTLGFATGRIQFTSDLLPADITGLSIFDPAEQRFGFHPGPIFTQLLLADEINRAPPKTQSALLEAMEEGQVTVDGHTHTLERPMFVVATQNPGEQLGVYPLPESQLDRFLATIELGYPDAQTERALLHGDSGRELLDQITPVSSPERVLFWQARAAQIHTAEPLVDYVQRLLAHSRRQAEGGAGIAGLSPRAGLNLLAVSKAWAMIDGRDMVLPEDVQTVFPHVASHRLTGSLKSGLPIATQILNSVDVE